jgi:hypothetical protein
MCLLNASFACFFPLSFLLDVMEFIGIKEKITLEWILREIHCLGKDWIHVAQDRDQ